MLIHCVMIVDRGSGGIDERERVLMRTSEALRQEDRLSTVGSFDSCSGGRGKKGRG